MIADKLILDDVQTAIASRHNVIDFQSTTQRAATAQARRVDELARAALRASALSLTQAKCNGGFWWLRGIVSIGNAQLKFDAVHFTSHIVLPQIKARLRWSYDT